MNTTLHDTRPALPAGVHPRHVQWVDGCGWRPVVAGGADGDNPPPAPTPPPAPAADLTGLQAALDQARNEGGTAATTALLQATGFDTPDALQAFVTAQREAAAAQMTEVERREAAAAEREQAAARQAADAAALIRRGVVNLALARAGVAPDVLDTAAPLVQLGDDLTDTAADAAVAALKAQPAFASLFTPPAPAPGGNTHPVPPAGGQPGVSSIQRGRELYEQRHGKTA